MVCFSQWSNWRPFPVRLEGQLLVPTISACLQMEADNPKNYFSLNSSEQRWVWILPPSHVRETSQNKLRLNLTKDNQKVLS